jgi:sterol desaturase/sphingolipid hydroxylase (fatty acid hydroxylase superfamily)
MAKLFVSNKDESPRIFKNSLLDLLSRVHWTAPLVVWVPFITYLLYNSLQNTSLSLIEQVGSFVAGMFIWTLAEYVLHRFIFHYHPTSEIGKKIHFLTHGIHHDYPNDSKRLVMPPVLAIILAIPFHLLYVNTLGMYYYTFFSGFLVGYLMYDMTHYALHHLNWDNPYFRRLREHHMIHHYSDPEHGFGVSSKLWDYVFHTDFNWNKKDKEQTDKAA